MVIRERRRRGRAGFHFPVNFSVGNPATSNGSEAEQPLRTALTGSRLEDDV